MNTFMRILLEEPFWLSVAAAPVLFVLWGVWNRTRTRATGRALVVGLVSTPLLFVLQAMVQTDREKLEGTTRQLSSAVQQGDLEGIVALVDPAAAITGVGDREAFRQRVTSLLETYTVQNNSIFDYQIEIEQDRANLTCRASSLIKSMQFTQTVRSRWKLEFDLKAGAWLITDVVPMDIAGIRYDSIGEIPFGGSGL